MAGHTKITMPTDSGLLQTPELYQYVMETSVYPREPEILKELRKISSKHPWEIVGTSPDAVQLMALMLSLINPKKTIEIGVFTGYSLLLTALNIPDDGKITAIDLDRGAYEMGLPIIEKSGVQHKINFIESEALPVLDRLLEDPKNEESFDFAFVDADKGNYSKYHEKLMKLVKPGGLIIYDNTLWGGTVAMPEEVVPGRRLASRKEVIKFNKHLSDDSRVQISQLAVGDGMTICKLLGYLLLDQARANKDAIWITMMRDIITTRLYGIDIEFYSKQSLSALWMIITTQFISIVDPSFYFVNAGKISLSVFYGFEDCNTTILGNDVHTSSK